MSVCLQICNMYVLGACRDQRVLDPLELELQAVVKYYVVLGTRPRLSAREASALNHRAPAPR